MKGGGAFKAFHTWHIVCIDEASAIPTTTTNIIKANMKIIMTVKEP